MTSALVSRDSLHRPWAELTGAGYVPGGPGSGTCQRAVRARGLSRSP